MRTYAEEIERARNGLRSLLAEATQPPWERVTDRHQGGTTTYGVWSEEEGRYAAAVSDREADAAYIRVMDPETGAAVADLLDVFLQTLPEELNTSVGHEACPVERCHIAAAVALARRVNRALREAGRE